MKKKKETSDRLTFGRHVDFVFTRPINTQWAEKSSKKVDKLLEKYEEKY